MYHFLPLAEKRMLRQEYRVRFAVVGCMFFSMVAVFGVLLLLPAWFVADIQEQTVKKRIEILQNTVAKKQDAALSVLLDTTKSDIKLLMNGEDFLSFRTIMETILDNRTAGVSLHSFSFLRISAEGAVGVVLKGVYRDRDALVNFRKSLEREKMFTRVDFPISNLAKGKNADFSIELIAVNSKQ